MSIKIRKASGELENFKPDKLLSSLMRAGADRVEAEEILEKVASSIKPFMTTRKIYRLARRYLKNMNATSGLRYSLKTALMRLGPTGYPFEAYFGELLRKTGYTVTVGNTMEGRCVKHEVDVLASNDREVRIVECKYRNSADNAPDVKIAMYVHSRMQDLYPVVAGQFPDRKISGWLVTNTRFTTDAIQYAECNGLHLMSWKYPARDSLEKLIDDKKLYPVTVLSVLTSKVVRKLIQKNIILMKDLAAMDVGEIQRLLQITARKAQGLKKQAGDLCLC